MLTILGKGIAGLSLAYELVKLGTPVRVIASRKRRRASDCAGGVLASKGLIEPKTLLFRAKLEGAAIFSTWLRDLENASSVRLSYDFSGVYEPIFSSDDFSRTENRIYRDLPYHFFGTKLLDHSIEGTSPYPKAFSVQPVSSFFYPRDGWFASDEILHRLESFLQRSGVLFCDEEIHSIGLNDGVLTIKMGSTEIAAERLVLALGAETGSELFEFDARIPCLKRVWGQTVVYRSRLFEGTTLGIVKGATSLFLRNGQMRYSASSSKNSLESPVAQAQDLAKMEQNLQAIYNLSTSRLELENSLSLVGARVLSEDRKPLIGKLWESKQSALYLYTGLYKNGFQFAPQCSRYLAAIILNREVPKDLAYLDGFNVSRMRI